MSAPFGCVILTMGDRPAELRHAIESVNSQRDVKVDCLVVCNGGEPPEGLHGARVLALPDNEGIPGGRNRGLAEVEGDAVLFLDDDAWLSADDALARVATLFDGDPALGIVSMRLADPDGGPLQRRHVPRLRVGDPSRGSEVTTFLGGASVIRRSVFDRVGAFPAPFFYAHEEMSLAWRAIDAGFRVRYEGSLVVYHPAAPASRHDRFHYLTARNRVWLVRLHLPWSLAVIHLALWLALSVARTRSLRALRQILRGYRDGLGALPAPRQRIAWRTVWRMTRLGRPPIL